MLKWIFENEEKGIFKTMNKIMEIDIDPKTVKIGGKPFDDYIFEAVIKKLANHMIDTSKKQPGIAELQCQTIISAKQCDEKTLNNAMMEIAKQNINIAPLCGYGRKDDAKRNADNQRRTCQ